MKPHRFDPISFASGALITLIGLVFLLPRDWGDLSWFITRVASWIWPAIFLVLGAAILIPALLPQRRESDKSQDS